MEQVKEKEASVFVGQVLYIEKANRNGPTEIVDVVVSKVGNKYFYLDGNYSRYPINKHNLKHENKTYSQCNFQLYRNKQEILDRLEMNKLNRLMEKAFNWSSRNKKFSLEQLRQVVNILELTE